jgi:hypothetical protein
MRKQPLFITAMQLTGDTAHAENLLYAVFSFLWEKPEFLRSSTDKYISAILIKLTREKFQESLSTASISSSHQNIF